LFHLTPPIQVYQNIGVHFFQLTSLSPPDHFTEGERMALAMVIRADETT
jgi:hypothetical protein